MGFLDKAKSAAEQAAQKAKEGAELAVNKTKETADDVQAKRGLSQAYGELGRATFELIESGELSHERLTPIADSIRELQARGEDDAPGEEAAEAPAAAEV